MPTVDQLSNSILNIIPEDLKAIHPLNITKNSDNKALVIGAQIFLERLKDYGSNKGLESVNYEDLHSLCQKIEDYFNNPRADPTSHDLVEYVKNHQANYEYYNLNQNKWSECASNARRFIEYTIKQELLFPHKKPVNLDKVKEYVELLGANNIDIITLNHDTLIEQLFGEQYYWTDGFEDNELAYFHERENKYSKKISYLSSDSFLDSSKIRILKPHGSCNWYRLSDDHISRLGIHRDGFRDDLYTTNGGFIKESPFSAGILSGSFTKERSYLFWEIGYMFRHTYRILHEYDRIIFSGYGFKDSGINNMLIEWIQRSEDKSILILENDESSNFKSIIDWARFTNLGAENRIRIHPEWLSAADPLKCLKLLNVETS